MLHVSNIYLRLAIFRENVGKYSSTMEHLGDRLYTKNYASPRSKEMEPQHPQFTMRVRVATHRNINCQGTLHSEFGIVFHQVHTMRFQVRKPQKPTVTAQSCRGQQLNSYLSFLGQSRSCNPTKQLTSKRSSQWCGYCLSIHFRSKSSSSKYQKGYMRLQYTRRALAHAGKMISQLHLQHSELALEKGV